ncbi:Bug family tripartite tricarboxylate transporter substrate binding protein [Pseudorhodoferax sp. Leaf274]|uniref:Bug family tripartite tricarboxylate transporter substrate binding protein n=1 Tax=Pseudorhodoferax sp. Leaf274 TaxID=1736318 RepID=UPI0007030AD1|nr:Bug family tripartite tricarboxylate transporter substrate binding protein [Pseudorhodoferax sp. Leaf274]KQP49790.1 twin-arginine translocation pathway signal protein [Pseudorhodoferax sp. Leaf274]
MRTRRQFTIQLGSLAALGATAWGRGAQAQPADLARLLVGFPPGGSTDNVARRLADKLRGVYAPNVIVENKPGAGTQIAVNALKDAAPDGATLLLSPPAPFTVYPYTYRKLPYANEDVAPVGMVCTFPFALAVGPAVPDSVHNLPDFVAWAKANPGKAAFGSPAAGSTPHLVGSLLGKVAGFEFTHVPYKGDAPGLQDLMGGQIAAYSTVLGSYLPHLQSGRLRLLAVSGTERSSFAPQLPTYREQGYPALDMTEWFGVFVPARTPAAIVQRAGDAVRAAVAQPDFARGLADFGMTARTSTAQELAERLRTENAQWRMHVKSIGFTADS